MSFQLRRTFVFAVTSICLSIIVWTVPVVRPVLHAQAGEPAAPSRQPAALSVRAERSGESPDLSMVRPALGRPNERVVVGPGSSGDSPSAMPATTVNVAGISAATAFALYGTRWTPPQPNGDIGVYNYVQAAGRLVQTYDRSGNATYGAFKLSLLFSELGGACATNNDGEVQVMYDPLAQRWILTGIALPGGVTPPYHLCVAVSKNWNPDGAFWVYDFVTPGNEYPESPRWGVWPDGYYMAMNQLLNGVTADGSGVFAFDRLAMLDGSANASYQYVSLGLSAYPDSITGLLPSDFDGAIAPPAGRPNTFAQLVATEWGDPADGLRLFDFHADFVVPANASFTERPEATRLEPLDYAFDPTNPTNRRDIRQPGATDSQALDSVSDRLLTRLQYRTNGSTESLVATHTVGAPPSTTIGTYRAVVQVLQATRILPAGVFVPSQLLNQAPADTTSRWMGSAAADRAGNIAVGYSASSSAVYPSLWYTGRLTSDPAQTFGQGENSLTTGTGIQTTTSNQWGNLSSMTVDPEDDCTFWYTGEYYTAESQATSSLGWLTRIAAFKFASCTPRTKANLLGTVVDANSSLGISGAHVTTDDGFSTTTDGSGGYYLSLAPGTRWVTYAAPGYVTTSFQLTQVAGNNDGSVGLAPYSGAQIVAVSATLASESLAPANNAIDPGEEVTVNLAVKNVGNLTSGSVAGSLNATGGVVSPGGAHTYGSILPGDTATGAFTFRASAGLACGAPITATLQLTEGQASIGTRVFTLPMRASMVEASLEEFETTSVPQLPAGWANNGSINWVTVATAAFAGTNAIAVAAPAVSVESKLDSGSYQVPSAGAEFAFTHFYDFEAGFDGAVLEVSINGANFIDITTAGGTFISGGYTSTLQDSLNPLAGRQAWSGNSGTYVTTVVRLPESAAGGQVRFRFRSGSDGSVGGTGWWVDALRLRSATCAPDAGEFVQNGSFTAGADGTDHWLKFALPNMTYMPWAVNGSVFEFARATGGTQAVAFQNTATPVASGGVLHATFRLGNTTTSRKRVSVLVHDGDFSDLSVCTFWLEPGAALATYGMRTHTTKAWTNASLSFYAATAGTEGGGRYRLDDVSMTLVPGGDATATDCQDPTAPGAGATTGTQLLTNGGFTGGTIAPWATFGNIASRLSGSVFEFYKQAGTPAGVILQNTGQAVADDGRLRLQFSLGNSSNVRQRATVLVHAQDFSDLTACTFWVAPATSLRTYTITLFATKAWGGAAVSVYPATVGTSPTHEWLRFTSASLTDTAQVTGTRCQE